MLKVFAAILLLTSLLLAQSFPKSKVNALLGYKKNAYLKKYSTSSKKKPTKPPYPQLKDLKRGTFEKTPVFEKRVADARKNLEKRKLDIDRKYLTSVAKWEKKQKEQRQKLQKAEENLPNVLAKSFSDILNTSFGKPTIKAFINNDVSSYNADDEIFSTKITSDVLSFDVQIQIPLALAEKLFKSKKLKLLKPIVKLEYSSGNLYINDVSVKYKNKNYNVSISDLNDYDSFYQLKYDVADVIVEWKETKIKDKDVLVFEQNQTRRKKAEEVAQKEAKKKQEVLAISKAKKEKEKKRVNVQKRTYAKSNVNAGACKGCHGAHFEKAALGRSKIVANMSSKDIATALLGYKNGTYGGMMKGIMKGQVARYSDSDLESFAQNIGLDGK